MTGHQRPEVPGTRNLSVVADGVIGAEFECLANVVVDASAGGTVVVLRMLGEIDMTTQAQVDTALRDGLHSAPRHLLVDLSQIVFCGARGIAGFADTGRTAAGNHVGFALCGLTPRLNRLTMMWGPGYPTRHHSVEVALTEIRAAGALLG